MKKLATFTSVLLTGMFSSQLALAESLVDGVYRSPGDANGNGQCTLVIKSVEQDHKYGDEFFELESTGDGACEWSALGVSKSYAISAGLVTNSGASAFVKVTFPFGPAGKKLEVTSFELDGSLRNIENFSKLDENYVVGAP